MSVCPRLLLLVKISLSFLSGILSLSITSSFHLVFLLMFLFIQFKFSNPELFLLFYSAVCIFLVITQVFIVILLEFNKVFVSFNSLDPLEMLMIILLSLMS